MPPKDFPCRLHYGRGADILIKIQDKKKCRQDKKRIARCEYCWNYFVPRTSHTTTYCDRLFDGKTCKQIGPNLKRYVEPEQDEALRICDRLRRHMASRMERYENATEEQRAKLFEMDLFLYGEWSDLARDAHAAYLRRKLTTKEFLRRIDVFHELDSYDESAPKEPGKSVFQERVERNIDFDPAAYQTIQVFDGRDSDAVPEWKTYSVEDCKRWE